MAQRRGSPKYGSDVRARSVWLLQNDPELLAKLKELGLTPEQMRDAVGTNPNESPSRNAKNFLKAFSRGVKKASRDAVAEANRVNADDPATYRDLDGQSKPIMGPDGRTPITKGEKKALEADGYKFARINSYGQRDGALAKMVTAEDFEVLKNKGSLYVDSDSPMARQADTQAASGKRQFEESRKWGEQKFLTPEQQSYILSDEFGDWGNLRRQFGAGVYGSGLGPVKQQTQLFNEYLRNLYLQGKISKEELTDLAYEVGHKGHVSIPGWNWAMNDPRNVVAQDAKLNRTLGNTQTLPEFLDANSYISEGNAYRLSPENIGELKRLQSEFPDQFPVGIFDVPRSDSLIVDPIRGGKNTRNFLFGKRGVYGDPNLSLQEKRKLGGLLVSAENFDHRSQQAISGILGDQDMSRLESLDPEIKSNLVRGAEKVSDEIIKSGENISAIEHINRAIAMLPEDQAKQLGKVDPKLLAIMAGVGAVGLPLMSPNVREAAIDKGIDALSFFGENVDKGEQYLYENSPMYRWGSDAYASSLSGLNSLTPNLGQTETLPMISGEDGEYYFGGQATPENGIGTGINAVYETFIEPFTSDAVKFGVGVLAPEFSVVDSGGGRVDSGGGGFW